jgi:hypothetical protein
VNRYEGSIAPRLLKGTLLASLVLALGLLWLPAAQAQTPTSLTDQVGGAASDVVDDTAGGVGDTITDTGGQVGQATEDAGKTVGDTVGGNAGDVVKDVTSQAGEAVKDTTATVGETVNEVGDKVTDTVNDPTGGSGGGGNGGPVSSGPGGAAGSPGNNLRHTRPGTGRPGTNGPGSAGGPAQDRSSAGTSLRRALDASTTLPGDIATTPVQPALAEIDRSPSAGDLARSAAEAAERFAFPLILMALVLAFVVAQGRLDKGDGKLVHAPMTSEQDLLSFQ